MTFFLQIFTLGHEIGLYIVFLGRPSRLRSPDLSLESPNDLQMTSRDPYWPLNINFLPNLTLGHVISRFKGFGCWVDCADQILVLSHSNDLFTKSQSGACNMSFPRFFSWLYLSDLSFHQMTSWVAWKYNFLTKIHFRACNMSIYRFFECLIDCAFPENMTFLPNLSLLSQLLNKEKSPYLNLKYQTHPAVI